MPLPEETDVAIIGAGMGGLTAAALLAKSGLRVAVLEMELQPGGYLAGFQRKRFVFDTAIHWLNQCGPRGGVRRILDFVDASAPATPPLRRIRRYRGESFDYLLTSRPDDLRDQLCADHPGQAEGIRRFFAAARTIGDTFEGMADHLRARETMSLLERATRGAAMGRVTLPFLKWIRHSTEHAFEHIFAAPFLAEMFCSEERLIACLTQVGWAYTGDYQVPPEGGSRAFPRFLAGAVEAWGGSVIYRARVDSIQLQEGRATGVTYSRGGRTKTEHHLRARYVLGACDLEALYERMLPPGTVDERTLQRLRAADLYDSSVSVFLATDVPPDQLGFGEELVVVSRDDVSRADHNCGDPERAAISVLAPSLRDPSLAPEGQGTVTLLTMANIAYAERWKSGPGDERGEAYQRFKQAYADVLIRRVEEAMAPGLREHIVTMEIATPLTHQRYTGNRDGSIMATRPSRPNFRHKVARYTTPVPNLYLSSHWAELGGGVPIAVRAGCNAALMVLKSERPVAFEVLAEVMDGRRAPDDPLPEGLAVL